MIKAWMIYLIGIPITSSSLFFLDPGLAGSLVGEYVLFGGIVLGLYYLGLKIINSKKIKKDQI